MRELLKKMLYLGRFGLKRRVKARRLRHFTCYNAHQHSLRDRQRHADIYILYINVRARV